MNQIKIGEFISSQRKLKNLTQMALAEKLNITDRAVSKWERGKSLPDVALMIPLCKILDITVNELLCGEKNTMENESKMDEKLLLEFAKELEQKNKTIWTSMWVIMIVSITAMISGIFLAKSFLSEGILQTSILIGITVLFLMPCFYALKLEVSVGAYKCKICGQEIEPAYSQALWAMHMGTTRYLKCPNCGKHSWCKKILKK